MSSSGLKSVDSNDPNAIAIETWIEKSIDWKRGQRKIPVPTQAINNLGGINFARKGYDPPLPYAIFYFIRKLNVDALPDKDHPQPYLPSVIQVMLQSLNANPNFGDPLDVIFDQFRNDELFLIAGESVSKELLKDMKWLLPIAKALVEYGATYDPDLLRERVPEFVLNDPEWKSQVFDPLGWQSRVAQAREYEPPSGPQGAGKKYRSIETSFVASQLEQAHRSLSTQCENLQDEYNLPELREMAKLAGLTGYSGLNKATLCRQLATVFGQRGGFDGNSGYRKRKIKRSGTKRKTTKTNKKRLSRATLVSRAKTLKKRRRSVASQTSRSGRKKRATSRLRNKKKKKTSRSRK